MLGEGRKKRGKEHQSIWQRQSVALSCSAFSRVLQEEGEVEALGSVEQLQELTLKPAEPLVSALLLAENCSPTFPLEQAQTSTRCRG